MALASALLSCQGTVDGEYNVHDTNAAANDTLTRYTAIVNVPTPSLLPDSVKWTRGVTSGTATLQSQLGTVSNLQYQLASPLRTDTLTSWLWTSGLRTMQKRHVLGVSGNLIEIAIDPSIEPRVRELFALVQNRVSKDSITTVYAQALVNGLAFAKGFPDSTPVGLDTATVRNRALRYASTRGISLDSLAKKWTLGMDYNSAKSAILALVPKISSADSLKLFPLGTKRDSLAPRITILTPSQTVAAATNMFSARWTVTDNVGLDSIWVNGMGMAPTDSSYTLLVNLTSGRNLVAIKARDKAGNVSQDSIVVLRLSSTTDTSAPTLHRLTAGTTVSYNTTAFVASWSVFDNTKVDSVWINGILAPSNSVPNDTTYSKTVNLAVGSNVIRIRAQDAARNVRTDSIVVVRTDLGAGPGIARLTAANSTVANSVTWIQASWVVRSPIRVKSVTINGIPMAMDTLTGFVKDSIAKLTVQLSVGGNPIVIKAINDFGDVSTDSVNVIRLAAVIDTIAPVLRRVTPLANTSVSGTTTSYAVNWIVKDNQALAAVQINGVKITSTDSSYTATIALLTGTNKVLIQAVDAAGNIAKDSVSIVRTVDTSAPSMTLVTPAAKTGTLLPFDSTLITVRYKIKHATGIVDTVRMNGLRALRENDSTWSARVPVPGNGIATAITTTAKTLAGTTGTDVISVTRRVDSTPPTVTKLASMPTSVPFDSTSALVGWTVTDNGKLASVTLNGVAITSANATYSSRVTLAVGSNKFIVVATDSMKNVRRDSVTIVRAGDATPPVIVRSSTTHDTTMDVLTNSVKLAWTVTDNSALGSVRVNGTPVTGIGGVYTATIPLVLGSNKVQIVATDASNNIAMDTLNVQVGNRAPAIAAGGYFGLYLGSNGTVTPWGTTRVPALTNVAAIAAGDQFSIALLQDGSVSIWDTTAVAMAAPAAMTNVRKIAAGMASAIAIKADSSVVVYGVNAALAIPTGLKAIQVATGNGYCLAVKSDSTVVVWGTGAGSAVPATLGKVKNVFASHDLASAITVNGEMVSWGNMGLPSPQVAKPNDTTGVRMVAPGMFHTLFLRANGALGGWGYNGASQAAIPAGAPTDGVAIAVGYRYSVVLRANGLVYAWGERNYNASVTPPAITSP